MTSKICDFDKENSLSIEKPIVNKKRIREEGKENDINDVFTDCMKLFCESKNKAKIEFPVEIVDRINVFFKSNFHKIYKNINVTNKICEFMQNNCHLEVNEFRKKLSLEFQDLLKKGREREVLKPINKQISILSLEETPKTSTEETPKDLNTQRSYDSPLKFLLPAIKKQAKLFNVSQIAKALLEQGGELEENKGSVNTVFKVPNYEKPEEIIGYCKEGAGGEKATGIMEEFIWQLATIFGLEESFAPTKVIEFGSEFTGGIQVAHEGITFEDYIMGKNKPLDQKEISQRQLIVATLISILFGFFDAHGNNLIVTKEGDIKFFDNTRCMPNSNGYINRKSGPSPAYRSALLKLLGSFQKLNQEELNWIKDEITKYKNKITNVESFVFSSSTKVKLGKLPGRWLDAGKSIDAMEERLVNIEKSLVNNEIFCLRDLVFSAMPDLKFPAILSILMYSEKEKKLEGEELKKDKDEHTKRLVDRSNKLFKADEEKKKQLIVEIQKKSLSKVGYYFMKDLLSNCCDLSIDPTQIKSFCDDTKFSFEQMILETCKLLLNEPNHLEVRKNNLRDGSRSILSEINFNSEMDLKDVSRKDVNLFLKLKTNDMLNTFIKIYGKEIIVKVDDVSRNSSLNSPGDFFVIPNDESFDPWICFKNKDNQEGFSTIQCTTSPYVFRMVGIIQSFTFEDLKEVLKTL